MAGPSPPDGEPWVELRQPTQCALWEKPELLNEGQCFDTVEKIVDQSHLARSVLKCRECDQLYFYEFCEIVDWEKGDDRIYWTFIPVDTPERVKELTSASPVELVRYTPRLLRDFTSNSRGTRWIR